jgi:hypothetical protein
MTLREGSVVGPYEICARAGAGGMGEVDQAIENRLNLLRRVLLSDVSPVKVAARAHPAA